VPGLLKEQTAIIMARTAGVGLTSVERLGDEGAHVMVTDIQHEAGAKRGGRLGEAVADLRADVMTEHAAEVLLATMVTPFRRLEIMYHNAGAVSDPSPFVDFSGGFDTPLARRTISVFWGYKHATRQFHGQSGGNSTLNTGRIVGLLVAWATLGYAAGERAITGSVGHPKDAAKAAVFPPSDMADYVASAMLPIDGGVGSAAH
jgi:NAD(P)-dependent dehydrogenase (short-subunit alcohol dehydrogenase family)